VIAASVLSSQQLLYQRMLSADCKTTHREAMNVSVKANKSILELSRRIVSVDEHGRTDRQCMWSYVERQVNALSA